MDSKLKLGEKIPHRGLIFLSASAITLSLFLLLFSWLFFYQQMVLQSLRTASTHTDALPIFNRPAPHF